MICRIGYSEKGWTDGEIGLAWIKDFNARTKDKAQGQARLLLVDGHNSHYTLELLEYARRNNIVLICYPAHTTHVLQGLDVVCFRAFKTYWTQETVAFEQETGQRVQKNNFLTPLARAYVRGFTVSTVKEAFIKTGTCPVHRGAITLEMMAPSKETSVQAHMPVELASPIRKVSQHIQLLQYGDSDGNGPSHAVPIWYTPTKTRTMNIDPALLTAAEIVDTLHDSNLSFLVSTSPIRSSVSLPPINLQPIPHHLSFPDHLLTDTAETPQAAELQSALRESRKRGMDMETLLSVDRTRLVLTDLHTGRLKHTLFKKEEKQKNKKKTRLMGDGHPRVLTSDHFTALSREHRDAQEEDEAEKIWKVAAKKEADRLRAAWKEEKQRGDLANEEITRRYKEDLENWMEEDRAAKAAHKRPRLKPKKPKRIPLPPQNWVKRQTKRPQEAPEVAPEVVDASDESGEDTDESESGDDGGEE